MRLSLASPATAGSPWTSGELAPRSRPSPLLLRLADVVSVTVTDPSVHAMTTMPSSAYEHPRLLCTSTAHERVRISSHHSSISSTRARLLFWVAINSPLLCTAGELHFFPSCSPPRPFYFLCITRRADQGIYTFCQQHRPGARARANSLAVCLVAVACGCWPTSSLPSRRRR
jgi:hypothetical protein